jgi:hypothetical protein
MRRSSDGLRFLSFLCWVCFAWVIAAEVGLLPRLVETIWLRWQVLLVAGLACWVGAERFADMKCRCCGAPDVLVRALFTPSRELLCGRCLNWKPSLHTTTDSAEVR